MPLNAPRAARSTPRCASCRARSARRCLRSMRSAARSMTSRTRAGRALQLTNILRDIDEDAAIGRLYLPREALQQVGIFNPDPAVVAAHPRLGEACEQVVARARQHFIEADRVMARCARRSVRAPRIMSAAYQ